MEFSASAFGTTVRMSEVNAMIDLYNELNAASVGHVLMTTGFEISARIRVNRWLSTGLDLHFQQGGAGSDRDRIGTSCSAMLASSSAQFGRLRASLAGGLGRSGYWFPAAFYESLRGWSPVVCASMGYALPISEQWSIDASIRLQWIPVYSMRDAQGGSYRSRSGPFLSFTGVGLVIGVHWTP